jgi:sugar phosphate isomerase/epimerase
MELDIGNAGYGGADPIAELRRYPGRARSIHVKDYASGRPDLLIGGGQVDWPKLIAAARQAGGAEWFIIEHETRPETAFWEIAESARRFREFERRSDAGSRA